MENTRISKHNQWFLGLRKLGLDYNRGIGGGRRTRCSTGRDCHLDTLGTRQCFNPCSGPPSTTINHFRAFIKKDWTGMCRKKELMPQGHYLQQNESKGGGDWRLPSDKDRSLHLPTWPKSSGGRLHTGNINSCHCRQVAKTHLALWMLSHTAHLCGFLSVLSGIRSSYKAVRNTSQAGLLMSLSNGGQRSRKR